jgi:predicted Kef-type K+ transport protein
MKPFIFSIFLTVLTCSTALANTDEKVVLVAHIDYDLTLTQQEIQNLFMGGYTSYQLTPISLKSGNELRMLFNLTVLGLTEARVQSYWSQMKFTGRKIPPKAFESEDDALLYVLRNKNTVTYINAEREVPDSLIVIFE